VFTVQQGCFLVVDDEPLATRCFSRVLSRFGSIATAFSVVEARERLRASMAWCGLVIDLRLPDGSGLDVLAFARRQGTRAPAIVLSGEMDAEAINGAYALDAKCLCKPCPSEHLRQFAHEALVSAQEVPTKITKAVSAIATKHALTPAQTEILMSAVRGIDRASIVAARHVSENTHKTQVRGILRKTRTLSLGELRDQVLRSVAGAA
jgi:DNA-binding NarL/FixJ family response regulator